MNAIRCYDKAIEINSNNADLLFNRVLCNVLNGNIENCLKGIEKVIKIGGNKYLEKIKQEENFAISMTVENFRKIIESYHQ